MNNLLHLDSECAGGTQTTAGASQLQDMVRAALALCNQSQPHNAQQAVQRQLPQQTQQAAINAHTTQQQQPLNRNLMISMMAAIQQGKQQLIAQQQLQSVAKHPGLGIQQPASSVQVSATAVRSNIAQPEGSVVTDSNVPNARAASSTGFGKGRGAGRGKVAGSVEGGMCAPTSVIKGGNAADKVLASQIGALLDRKEAAMDAMQGAVEQVSVVSSDDDTGAENRNATKFLKYCEAGQADASDESADCDHDTVALQRKHALPLPSTVQATINTADASTAPQTAPLADISNVAAADQDKQQGPQQAANPHSAWGKLVAVGDPSRQRPAIPKDEITLFWKNTKNSVVVAEEFFKIQARFANTCFGGTNITKKDMEDATAGKCTAELLPADHPFRLIGSQVRWRSHVINARSCNVS